MNCTACNTDLPAGAGFCPECGTTAVATIACKFCGEANAPDEAFCSSCGKSTKSDLPSVAKTATPELSKAIGSEFAWLFDEESYRSVSSAKVDIPYGAIAVTLVDGKVQSVKQQGLYAGNKSNSILDFLGSIKDQLLGLAGQREQKIQSYILLNLQDLPIVTYTHPVPTPGQMDAALRFDFWVESNGDKTSPEQLQNIGLFFQRCMGSKRTLSINDFLNLAIGNIPNIVAGIPAANLGQLAEQENISKLLLRATGISSRCVYVRSRKTEQKNIDISKFQKPIVCSGCDSHYFSALKFCEVCGQDLSSALIPSASFLQAENKEEITIRLRYTQDSEDGVVTKTTDEITEAVVNLLGPVLRRRSVASLMDGATLEELEKLLNVDLVKQFQGYITEVKVVDIRTASEDWFFRTDALVKEELRKIESDKQFLDVDGAKIDLQEAAFAITMRRVHQNNSEELQLRKAGLEARANIAEVEISEHELETKVDLRKEGIDDKAEQERLEREKAKMLRERDFNREQAKGDREDEHSSVDHTMGLEKKVAAHDIDLADMTGEAQSRSKRRDVSDLSFEQEEAIRLEAERMQKLGHIGEDLQDRQNQRQLDKLKAMAEMEANMAKQDADFELAKMSGMKGMSPQEILAMQAAQLVKSGGGDAAADIVKAIAESQAAAAGAGIKDELYSKMLDIQKEASQSAIDAHKSAAEIALKSSENMSKVASSAATSSNEGYKEAAKIAQTTNEKSMESMAKVATAAAGKKPGKEEADTKSDTVACINSECEHTFEGKAKKFCPKCGTNQFDN
jgi:hypothetical protein